MQHSAADTLARAYYAALISAGLLLVVAVLVRAIPPDPGYIRATFTPEHVELLNLFDNRGQQWAHRILVGLLGALALVFWAVRPKPIGSPSLPVQRTMDLLVRYGGIVLAVLFLLVLFDGRPLVGDQRVFHGRYVLFPVTSIRTQSILAIFGIVAVAAWSYLNGHPKPARIARTIALAATATYIFALIFVGVSRPPSFLGFAADLMTGVEWHYGGAVASADRIGIGERLGEVPIHSSLLASVLLGIRESAYGLLDFGDHVRLIASLQVAMIVVAAIAYGFWNRWRAGAWLLGLLLVLPWIQPMQAAVLYPNQSSWRFLGLCIGVAALALVHAAKSGPAAAALGFVGGFALLWNAESGLVLNLAYCVFLMLRQPQAGFPGWKGAAVYAAGAACAFLGFCIVVRAGLGYWPDALALLKSFPLIGNFSTGYGGLAFTTVDLLALLVFAHALFLVTRGILDWGSGQPLSPRECARVAIAALLVAWAAYYFKAPHPWNLWTSLMIYGFLIEDLLPRPSAAGKDAGLWRLIASPGPMALAIVIVPAVVATNSLALSSMSKALRQPQCAEGNVVSGICLPGDLADLVKKKADALRVLAAEQRVLYFTSDVYLMPLVSGVSLPLRQRDAFSDSVRPADFDQLIADARAADPACILYDDPSSRLTGYEAQRKFYARLRATLSPGYERRGAKDGWQIDCRRGSR